MFKLKYFNILTLIQTELHPSDFANQSNVRVSTAANHATISPAPYLKIKSEYQIAPVTPK
jgi:hypothetical protein